MDYMGIKKTAMIAKLENGELVEYDACGRKRQVDDYHRLKYIGKGTIYSINGVRQRWVRVYHFWKKRNKGELS